MDLLQLRRRAAHMQSAFAYDRSADFHRAVAAHFETMGDNLNAVSARQRADEDCLRAAQERLCAFRATRTSGTVAA